MKAYCINLDRRPDRRDHMWAEFARIGIDVERVAAVDGSLPDVLARTVDLPPGINGRRLGTGAYACFQSHRMCWRKLIDSAAAHAMILEDDLLLAVGFAQFLLDDWVPRDADIVRLETFGGRVHLDRQVLHLERGRYLARLRSLHFGGGCYVISNSAALRLYRQTETIADAVDDFLFNPKSPVFDELLTYQMVPAPAIQGDQRLAGKSDTSWLQTSIENRFGPGEKGNTVSHALPARVVRRAGEEFFALRKGTRYTLIEYG